MAASLDVALVTFPSRHIRMRRTLLVALTGVLACSRSSEPVYIGVAGPWKEEYGRMNKQGIDLAMSEINARGGVRGRPLRIVERDDEGTGTKAAAIAAEFVANRDVVGVVGHVTSGAMIELWDRARFEASLNKTQAHYPETAAAVAGKLGR